MCTLNIFFFCITYVDKAEIFFFFNMKQSKNVGCFGIWLGKSLWEKCIYQLGDFPQKVPENPQMA